MAAALTPADPSLAARTGSPPPGQSRRRQVVAPRGDRRPAVRRPSPPPSDHRRVCGNSHHSARPRYSCAVGAGDDLPDDTAVEPPDETGAPTSRRHGRGHRSPRGAPPINRARPAHEGGARGRRGAALVLPPAAPIPPPVSTSPATAGPGRRRAAGGGRRPGRGSGPYADCSASSGQSSTPCTPTGRSTTSGPRTRRRPRRGRGAGAHRHHDSPRHRCHRPGATTRMAATRTIKGRGRGREKGRERATTDVDALQRARCVSGCRKSCRDESGIVRMPVGGRPPGDKGHAGTANYGSSPPTRTWRSRPTSGAPTSTRSSSEFVPKVVKLPERRRRLAHAGQEPSPSRSASTSPPVGASRT